MRYLYVQKAEVAAACDEGRETEIFEGPLTAKEIKAFSKKDAHTGKVTWDWFLRELDHTDFQVHKAKFSDEIKELFPTAEIFSLCNWEKKSVRYFIRFKPMEAKAS